VKRKLLLSIVLIIACVILIFVSSDPDFGLAGSPDNLLIFLFVNFNILFLCVSAFLVGRELIKLVVDRRRNILGSRLRWRLIVPFLGLTAIPLVLLFVLASGLLNRAMDGWFKSSVESTRDASVLLAKSYYEQLRIFLLRETKELGKQVPLTPQSRVQQFLERQRQELKLFSVSLRRPSGRIIAETHSPLNSVGDFTEPDYDVRLVTSVTEDSGSSVVFEGEGAQRFLRVYAPVRYLDRGAVLILSHRLDPEITESFQIVRDSYNEYRQLKLFRNPLRSGYMVTFALVAGMILFAALWLVVQIARTIVEPIERLVRGTELISKGEYNIAIDPGGDDEIGNLINSFNLMAQELEASRTEAQRQRLLVESILANLSVGVVTIGRDEKVLMINKVAQELVGEDVAPDTNLRQALSTSIRTPISTLLDEVGLEEGFSSFNVQCSFMDQGREIRVMCTAGRISNALGEWIATVLLLDDITELVKAQQMSAWREVARRIAHEIKNPLTPLKLSAQRLLRRASRESDTMLEESTQTIVEHVDSIKRLADEFSNFARMPTAEFSKVNFGGVIADVVTSYVDTCGDVHFKVILDSKLPDISIDAEQMRRVLVNILDNAVSSVRSMTSECGEPGRILVRLEYDKKRKRAVLEVSDNGLGIPESDRYRVFDPYFTRKKGGTGLGLAIVSSIISEHQGGIRVLANGERGSKFLIDLPLSQRLSSPESLVDAI
jgi:two-component system nitrogen regulation sensor histidine kinase NtrY